MSPTILDKKSNLNIADIRRRYTKKGLIEEDLPDDPILLFKNWFQEAVHSEVIEPNAMALATVNPENLPNVRTVLLKGIEDHSITFFTNYKSRKAKELAVNPFASCVFWWAELERQVRLTGRVNKLSEKESADYFQIRPRESQIGAWSSHQSQPIAGRRVLQERFAKIENKYEGQKIPKPDYWGGYEIVINEIEFWQGRPGRLHDRIHYRKHEEKWQRDRLAP